MGRRVALVLAALAALSAVPAAHAAGANDSKRTTFLLSRAADGGFPDGPSRNAAVSHDQRIARYMAYESDATNIVGGDSNGLTDVFLVRRDPPYSVHGTPWRINRTELASRGIGGAPANGRSYRPALDGDSHHKPHCVAFVSEASNLVRGDTNGVADAFVKDIRTGRLRRVSVSSGGKQANGPTTEVAIDGACERVAFVSAATNLGVTRTGRREWRSARTTRPPAGVRQVYVRVLGGERHDRGFRGLTFLASASHYGRAANGHSYDVTFARNGKAVAFASEATNLSPRDRSAVPDVYRRGFTRRFEHLGHGRGLQRLIFRTLLVSQNRAGRPGNGASGHPAIDDVGRHVAYETLATNLLPRDGNGVSDIARADTAAPRRPVQRWISRSSYSGVGNGASHHPVISGAGEFVLFESDASNLRPSGAVRPDGNGVRDVFLWNQRSGNVSLESRDSLNGYLAGAPSHDPATSSRGNYVPFESGRPLPEEPGPEPPPPPPPPPPPCNDILCQLFPPPGARAARAGTRTPTEPDSGTRAAAVPQIWVRYLGPR